MLPGSADSVSRHLAAWQVLRRIAVKWATGRVGSVITAMEPRAARLNLVLLDADLALDIGRGNAVLRGGPAAMDLPENFLIWTSARLAPVTDGGDQANSVLTAALAEALRTPGLSINQTIRDASRRAAGRRADGMAMAGECRGGRGAGTHALFLTLTAFAEVRGAVWSKSSKSFEHTIPVEVRPFWDRARGVLADNWQWLWRWKATRPALNERRSEAAGSSRPEP